MFLLMRAVCVAYHILTRGGRGPHAVRAPIDWPEMDTLLNAELSLCT